MKLFRTDLALLIACAAIAYFVLIPRNEFAWMAAELSEGQALPVDDLQGAKEVVSIVLLVLGVGAWAGVASSRRSVVAIASSAVAALFVFGAWQVLFWQM